jgi:hypothetical protein
MAQALLSILVGCASLLARLYGGSAMVEGALGTTLVLLLHAARSGGALSSLV